MFGDVSLASMVVLIPIPHINLVLPSDARSVAADAIFVRS
jgi:hypothetical protein